MLIYILCQNKHFTFKKTFPLSKICQNKYIASEYGGNECKFLCFVRENVFLFEVTKDFFKI